MSEVAFGSKWGGGEIKRLRLRMAYSESSMKNKSNQINGKAQEIEHLKEELELKQHELNTQLIHCQDLVTQNRDFDDENIWPREMLKKNITTFDDQSKTYTTDLQKCVFELLGYNVSFQNVSPVISSVLQLVSIKPNKLPCKTTINNMNIERLALSQKHIAK